MIFTLIFVLCMFYHIYTDFREMLLYNWVQLVLLATACVRMIVLGEVSSVCLGFLACGTLMLLLYFISRGGMGEGDVKLGFVLGVWLGVEQGLLCLFLAFLVGALVGIFLLLLGICKRKQVIPFGPYMCFSALAMYFYGEIITDFYWQLLIGM